MLKPSCVLRTTFLNRAPRDYKDACRIPNNLIEVGGFLLLIGVCTRSCAALIALVKMYQVQRVADHFSRGVLNNLWEYPEIGALLSFDREFPSMAPFYFSWEKNYDPIGLMGFSRNYYWLGPFAAFLYVVFVFVGPRMMADRKPFDLNKPLRYWNLFLAIFSFWGMIRMIPQLLLLIHRFGFYQTLCIPPIWTYGSGAAGLWTGLFVYSKYIELVDTVFIVLRKRPLSFLHWYHHATVLLYTWDAFVNEQPPGLYFCTMNYIVHALMYYYYYLASKSKPPSWGMVVTVLQITQMLLGSAITLIALVLAVTYPAIFYTTRAEAQHPFQIPGCYMNKQNLLGGLAMYSTYFYLFAVFFVKRYISNRPRDALKEKNL